MKNRASLLASRSLLLPALGLLLSSSPVFAADAPSAPEPLTLNLCVQRALAQNLGLAADRFGPDIARESVAVADAGFTPNFSLSTQRGLTRDNGIKTKTADTRLGVTQRFGAGTTVGVTTQLDRRDTTLPSVTLNPAYNADLSVSVRQPLLAGAGSEVTRANQRSARLGLDRAQLDYRSSALDTILATEKAYHGLAFAREQLIVRQLSLKLATQLQDEARTRRDTGVATDLDVLQAEVGVANAQRSVLLAEQTVHDRSEQLLGLISRFQLDAPIGPLHLATPEQTVPVLASSLDAAKRHQPDYLSAQAALEQARIDLQVAKNARQPELSIGGAVGFNGDNRHGGPAYNDALNRENSAWQVDLTLNYAWGQQAERARYRQSLASVSRQEFRLRQQEQDLELSVRAALRAVETNLENLRIATLAARLSEKQHEQEKARFDAGLSTSRRVLEALNDFESARISELQATVDLRDSYAALHRLEGSSLERYSVNLP